MKNVLFICIGNSIRSQMAEGYLQHYAFDTYKIFSAGVAPYHLHPMAVEVMMEDGVDISGSYAKALSEVPLDRMDIIVTLDDAAREACLDEIRASNAALLHWPFEDPIRAMGSKELRQSRFRMVRDQIRAKVLKDLRQSEES